MGIGSSRIPHIAHAPTFSANKCSDEIEGIDRELSLDVEPQRHVHGVDEICRVNGPVGFLSAQLEGCTGYVSLTVLHGHAIVAGEEVDDAGSRSAITPCIGEGLNAVGYLYHNLSAWIRSTGWLGCSKGDAKIQPPDGDKLGGLSCTAGC